MRPISWLHISDFHLRVSAAWSQDIVLKAMCEDFARQRKGGISADFILASFPSAGTAVPQPGT
jgi:hypothetical protein